MPDRTWMTQAACRGEDPELFFPPVGDRQTLVMARNVCRNCPVQIECGTYGEETGSCGMWGGHRRGDAVSFRQFHSIGGPRPAAQCGTEAGARRHYRNGEKPCSACLEAASRALRERRAAR